jgi:hypothetical protein
MNGPQPPAGHADDVEFAKIAFKGEVDEQLAQSREAAEAAAATAAQTAAIQLLSYTSEAELNKSIHDARLEVAKAAIERGQSGAEFVRNAAAAIVTLYTGILGLAFAATDPAKPLPPRGVAAAVFLGLALAFASAYAALLTSTPAAKAPTPHAQLEVFQERRLNAFVDWVSAIAFGRLYFLHASVLALGAGVLFLPAPFLAVSDCAVVVVAGVGLLATLLVPFRTARP